MQHAIHLIDLILRIGVVMRKGPYSLDLKKQIKVRLDDITFEKLTKVSEEQKRTISSILRDIIVTRLTEAS